MNQNSSHIEYIYAFPSSLLVIRFYVSTCIIPIVTIYVSTQLRKITNPLVVDRMPVYVCI